VTRAAQHKESMQRSGGGQALRQVCALFSSMSCCSRAVLGETVLFSSRKPLKVTEANLFRVVGEDWSRDSGERFFHVCGNRFDGPITEGRGGC